MNRIRIACTAVTLAALLALVGCGNKEGDETYRPGEAENQENTATAAPEDDTTGTTTGTTATGQTAQATLQGAAGESGTVTITEEAGGGVRIIADFTGVADGKHGFHVHENGQCDHDAAGGSHFTSAGGHFNPTNAEHACPPTTPRHAGDLGNLVIRGGRGHLEISSADLSLSGPNSLVGKALILHANEDDCKTQPTGNSGDRVVCGVVAIGQ